ncbi:DMT family transporter [Rhodobacteraceae bacterium RKSG542]|uniref:DMT family transporter n=1 Tax=Pseudovibrio flavus TaxID=2529854 RepID=UPI0012BBA55D|nr:DMT family transporter [Pseudovibrio flavus]MTI15847.1 DMT family transporter [Pseudovibrio flavus]
MSSTPAASTGLTKTELLGILLSAVGYLAFSLNDAFAKWLLQDYGVGQLLVIRSIAALLFMSPLIYRRGIKRTLIVENPKLNALRVFCCTMEVLLFYVAVLFLTLAKTLTFYMAAPIFAALLSIAAGHRLSMMQWAIIIIGFIGVVIALEPGGGVFDPACLIALAGSFMLAAMLHITHHLKHVPDLSLIFWQNVGALVMASFIAPIGWGSVDTVSFMQIALLGIIAMCAHMMLNRSVKLAQPHIVAPIQYTLILYAILFGYLFFNDVPTKSTLVGAALILGASAMLPWAKKAAPKPAVSPQPAE